MSVDISTYASWFRSSTPYIQAHRGKTFVIHLPAAAIEHPNLVNIVHDLALLHVLGVRLVLAHGSGAESRLLDLFATGLPNTPLHGANIPIEKVACVPKDRQHTDLQPMDINAQRLRDTLDRGAIAALPPSMAAVANASTLAVAATIALQADKLLLLGPVGRLYANGRAATSILGPGDLAPYLKAYANDDLLQRQLEGAAEVVRSGIPRAHLVSYAEDGALLQELFTAAGQGTQISEPTQTPIRAAAADDIPGILALTAPLIAQGALVPRDSETLSEQINDFIVAELDGIVIGCCAIHTYPEAGTGELACVAVDDSYRQSHERQHTSIGTRLLEHACTVAAEAGITSLFALTTGPVHWFVSHGFTAESVKNLPESKQSRYDHVRAPAILRKRL